MPSVDSPTSISSLSTPSNTQVTKPFSISLSKPKPSTVGPSTNARKRPHSSLADDSDSDRERQTSNSHQLVTAFDGSAGGAIGAHTGENERAPLVIPRQKNRDWREESLRRKQGKRNLLPAEERARREGKVDVSGKDVVNGEPQAYGLSFVKKEEATTSRGRDGDIIMGDALVDVQISVEIKPKTADEEALVALLGDESKTKSRLVLPALDNPEADKLFTGRAPMSGVSEGDLFRTDVASRPESATFDEYAAVPVEEFGLALLRGMGWKEGDVVGKRKDALSKTRVVERRPALLGIGAKEIPEGLEEMGAWGKAAMGKRKMQKDYSPIMIRNTKTGELLTEEEMKDRKEGSEREKGASGHKRDEEDWRERRERNLAIDDKRKAERRRRNEDETREGSRHGGSKRERSRSSERRREKRRDDEDSFDRRDKDRRHKVREDERGSSSSRHSSKHRDRERREHNDNGDDSRESARYRDRGKDDYGDTRSRRRQEVY